MQQVSHFAAVRFLQPLLGLCSAISRLALISGLILGFATLSLSHAVAAYSTTYLDIDSYPDYLNYFQYDDGTGNDYWWAVSLSTNPTNGHVTINFQDGNGGNSSMEWEPTGKLVLWTITLGGGRGSLSYTDGANVGLLGEFVQQSGPAALNKVININDAPYQASGNQLIPATTSFNLANATTDATSLLAFTYNGTTYQPTDIGHDYAGRTIAHYAGGVTTISSLADLCYYPEQIEIGFPNGTLAKYIGEHGAVYTYRPSSTAPNQLTKLNGYPLAASGNTLTLPKSPIQNFVWNGNLYTLDVPMWIWSGTPTSAVPLRLAYFYTSLTAYFDGNNPNYPNGFSDLGEICSLQVGPDGSLVGGLYVQDTPEGGGEEHALLTGGPVNYLLQDVTGNSSFSAINGHAYVTNGASVVPVPPVANFVYNGKTYQAAGTSLASDGSMATAYTASGGGTATVNWSRATDEVIRLKVRPTSAAATASYVNGDAVGRPGAYVWSAASTLPNKLTQINSSAYTIDGDAALPTGGFVNSNGVFDVQGNFLSLGAWSNDASHVGFSLSYDDGEPVTVPASIEFTASRPLTNWLWTAATTDGSSVTQLMQLDYAGRLSLYPPASNAPGAPAAPTPTVVLDPNSNGLSRFDGPVRIAPQGDLSMGAFTTEPAR